MFEELMPLLGERVLILTLSRVNQDEICLTVTPKPLKASEREENSAVRTPLSLTGTPQELDRELPRQLAEFADLHLQLSSTLLSAKMEMEAATNAAQEAARKSIAAKSRGSSKIGTSNEPSTALTPAAL